MKFERIGKRGILFTFSDLQGTEYDCLTNIYVINGHDHVFFCDTCLGPELMEPVKEQVGAAFGIKTGEKPIVVFNSHFHWDHIWGNCAFPGSVILGHALCRERILEAGLEELKEHQEFQRGKVKLVPPSITFSDRISFPEEGVEFYYTPGHTMDSATCIDHVDQVLFAGDNVEEPIPSYMCSRDLQQYARTLKGYMDTGIGTVITGHGPAANHRTLSLNLQYLQDLMENNMDRYEEGRFRKNHLDNLRNLGM